MPAKRTKTTKTEQIPPAPTVTPVPPVPMSRVDVLIAELRYAANVRRNAIAEKTATWSVHNEAIEAARIADLNYVRALGALDDELQDRASAEDSGYHEYTKSCR
jgi:hypothetical protein